MSSDTESESSLPDSFDALTRVCISCGDAVARRYLDSEGRCVGCRQRGEPDE